MINNTALDLQNPPDNNTQPEDTCGRGANETTTDAVSDT